MKVLILLVLTEKVSLIDRTWNKATDRFSEVRLASGWVRSGRALSSRCRATDPNLLPPEPTLSLRTNFRERSIVDILGLWLYSVEGQISHRVSWLIGRFASFSESRTFFGTRTSKERRDCGGYPHEYCRTRLSVCVPRSRAWARESFRSCASILQQCSAHNMEYRLHMVLEWWRVYSVLPLENALAPSWIFK